ncbi:MAG: DJ-1/PfpI family protein, partial [Prolixibacteraceae bacterium]|nr:DJ-1/PfpI family protein [Prolixibacteraceae bacterium]
MKSVVLMLADGFEEMEAVIPADVLRRAGFNVSLVSVTGRKGVTGSHGIRVEADLLFGEADFGEVDMVVLPGGMPGAAHLNT